MIVLFPNGEERTSLNNVDEQPKLRHLLRKPFHVLAYFIVGEPEGCQVANTYGCKYTSLNRSEADQKFQFLVLTYVITVGTNVSEFLACSLLGRRRVAS
jgi:hypothetical protein